MSLYLKNSKGKMVPLNISSVINKDLDNHLVIVRVGTDELPASNKDVDLTESSLAEADVLNDLGNISVVVTPYQLDIEVLTQEEIDNKSLCLQIKSGEDISGLEDRIKSMYRRLKSKFSDITILPTPVTIKDYRQVKDTLKRCRLRKKRRSRTRA